MQSPGRAANVGGTLLGAVPVVATGEEEPADELGLDGPTLGAADESHVELFGVPVGTKVMVSR